MSAQRMNVDGKKKQYASAERWTIYWRIHKVESLKDVSRSALYYQMLPARSNTIAAKRHVVNGAPVRFLQAKNNHHKEHPDFHFTANVIKMLKQLCCAVGPRVSLFISSDDKAKVPLGISAAQMQEPILMHMQYKVMFPDHTLPVASGHKLVPSVVSINRVQKLANEKEFMVRNSGPTMVRIRSDKHDRSTASTHMADINALIDAFPDDTKCDLGNGISSTKPVIVITTDNGPDTKPVSAKIQRCAIALFKSHTCDALFWGSFAPYHSAYNNVERRMAPLSAETAGYILPHHHCGNHLLNGRTIDMNLELQNFAYAGNILAEIWSAMKTDDCEVRAAYIQPGTVVVNPPRMNFDRIHNHVRLSQYLFQVVRCNIIRCCGPWRSTYQQLFPQRFLLSATPMHCSSVGLVPAKTDKDGRYFGIFEQSQFETGRKARVIQYGFHRSCPSKLSVFHKLTCGVCDVYHPTKVMFNKHKRACVKRDLSLRDVGDISSPLNSDVSDDDDELNDDKIVEVNNDNSAKVFDDLQELLLRGLAFVDDPNLGKVDAADKVNPSNQSDDSLESSDADMQLVNEPILPDGIEQEFLTRHSRRAAVKNQGDADDVPSFRLVGEILGPAE